MHFGPDICKGGRQELFILGGLFSIEIAMGMIDFLEMSVVGG